MSAAGSGEQGAGAADAFDMADLLAPPDPWQPLLRRCAVASPFDAEVYQSLLRADGDPELEQLVGSLLVRPLAAGATHYRVAEDLIAAQWEYFAEPGRRAELDELCTRLADYHALHESPPDQLRHRMIADPGAAITFFQECFRIHEELGALTRCRELLDVLADPYREPFLDDRLDELRGQYGLRLAAHSLRAADVRATGGDGTRYLPRPRLQDEVKQLFDPDSDARWLKLVVGGGALGKTTLLRWLLARGCPAPDPAPTVAAARLDCAAYGEAAILETPWLLLVEAARQLDRQLARGPFHSFLRRYGSDVRRLHEGADHTAYLGGDDPHPADRDERRGAAAIEEFRSILVDTRPALIVIDTLDRCYTLSTLNKEPLRRLVEMLVSAHRVVPSLRMALACRYDLRELVPALRDIEGTEPVRVELFDDAEAVEFLEMRNVGDPELRAAIVARSQHEPMLLDMITERDTRGLTVHEVRNMSEPIFTLLAERFLSQVPNPVVRCVLWFACLSPRLRFDVFRWVFLPALRDERAWRELLPQLDKQFRSLDNPYNDDPWLVPEDDGTPGGPVSALWQQIVHQASLMRWMDADDDGISVNPAVVAQLRKRLRDYELYRGMHRRLAEFAEDQLQIDVPVGEEAREAWPRWQRMAIYHHACAQDTSPAESWREAVAQARRSGRLDWARAVTEGLFADFDPDVDGEHRRLLSKTDRYVARVEFARLIAQQGGLLPGPRSAAPPGWRRECAAALDSAATGWPTDGDGNDDDDDEDSGADERAAGDDSEHVTLARQHEQLLRLALEVEASRSSSPAPAEPETQPDDAAMARPAQLDPATFTGIARRDVLLVLARASRNAVPSPAATESTDTATGRESDAYLPAWESALECGGAAWIALEAGRSSLADDRFTAADAWCGRALVDAPPDPDGSDPVRGEVPGLRARVLLCAGQPAAALTALDRADRDDRVIADYRTEAECRLALRQPAVAAAVLAEALGQTAADTAHAEQIAVLLLFAAAHGELLDAPAAESAFERAQRLADESGAEQGSAVAAARARYALTVAGDLSRAQFHLSADPGGARPGGAVWIELESCRAELAVRQGDLATAAQLLQGIAQTAAEPGVPRNRRLAAYSAVLTVATLPGPRGALSDGRHRTTTMATTTDSPPPVKVLDRWLDEIDRAPLAERAGLLAGLRRCAALRTFRPLRHRVGALFPTLDDRDAATPSHAADAAFRDVAVAELFRVVGEPEIAQQLRDHAVEVFSADDPFLHWEFLAAEDQVRLAEPVHPEVERFRARYAAWPMLLGSFLVELVNVYGHEARYHVARRWLTEAGALFGEPVRRPTIRHLRLWEAEERAARARGNSQEQRIASDHAAAIRAELGLWDPAALAVEGPERLGQLGQVSQIERLGRLSSPPDTDIIAIRQVGVETTFEVGSDESHDADHEFTNTDTGTDPTASPGPGSAADTEDGQPQHDSALDDERAPDADRSGPRRPALIVTVGDLEALGDDPTPADLARVALPVGSAVAEQLAGATPRSVAVQVAMTSPEAGALPWEILDVGHVPLSGHPAVRSVTRRLAPRRRMWHQIRCVQGALRAAGFEPGPPDGTAGPRTLAALRALRDVERLDRGEALLDAATLERLARIVSRKATGQALRIQVIQPVVGGNLDALRQTQDYARVVARAYEAAFRNLGSQQQPQPYPEITVTAGDQIPALTTGRPGIVQPVHVLHVCTVMEPTQHMPTLGFGANRAMPITAAELDLVVRALTGAVPPLVIVDVLAPPSSEDLRRQLILRNRFAHQLLELGAADTVIATGFEPTADRFQPRTIAECLANGATAGEICRRIQRHQPFPVRDSEANLPAYQGTALFSGLSADFPIVPGAVRHSTPPTSREP